MTQWTIDSLEDTHRMAVAFSAELKAGDVICLFGEMGAGKTTFVSSLVAGLGSEDWVSSPTFSLVQEYQGRLPVRHLDLYRLQGSDLGLMDIDRYLDFPQGVVVIEWPDQLGKRLSADWIRLSIEVLDEDRRRITMQS
jgi:tRNA threonylcarbamoyladenosine biosynthesis protein TsaE